MRDLHELTDLRNMLAHSQFFEAEGGISIDQGRSTVKKELLSNWLRYMTRPRPYLRFTKSLSQRSTR